MALAEKYRTIIYTHFVETIGEEAAEAMLSQFPARDLDEPVTKEFVHSEIVDVRRELAVLRGEMHAEVARVRGEMTTGFADVRGDMSTGFADVRGEMTTGFAELRTEMKDLTNQVAVRLQVTVGVVVGVVGGLLAVLTIFTS